MIEFEIQLKNQLYNLISISIENEEKPFEYSYLLGPLLKEHIIPNSFVIGIIQKLLVHGSFEDLDFRSEMLLEIIESCGDLLYKTQKKYFYCIIEGLSIQCSSKSKENLQEVLRIIQTEKVQKRIIFKGSNNTNLKSYFRNVNK